jgi:hypothetical protein
MSRKVENVSRYISDNFTDILGKIEIGSLDVYDYLKTTFNEPDVSKNYFFQFVFRSFYGLDSAGLSPNFKEAYFGLLQNNRGITIENADSVFKSIASELYGIPNLKTEHNKGCSLQISFVSKLVHTASIENDFPIYDSKVSHLMGFSYVPNNLTLENNIESRINDYLKQIGELRELYACIDNQLGKQLEQFNNQFKRDISKEKKIDFILWTAGKVKQKEDEEKRKEKKALKIKNQ